MASPCQAARLGLAPAEPPAATGLVAAPVSGPRRPANTAWLRPVRSGTAARRGLVMCRSRRGRARSCRGAARLRRHAGLHAVTPPRHAVIDFLTAAGDSNAPELRRIRAHFPARRSAGRGRCRTLCRRFGSEGPWVQIPPPRPGQRGGGGGRVGVVIRRWQAHSSRSLIEPVSRATRRLVSAE